MREIFKTLLNEIKKAIVENGDEAYLVDKTFSIIRNRENAEIINPLIKNGDIELANKIGNFLVSRQNKNGSWNEVHPFYNEESALITSIVGMNLKKVVEDSAIYRAEKYVRACLRGNYFLKSKRFTADHINVDATCSAFVFEPEVIRHIFRQGVPFPYCVTRGNYGNLKNNECIFYQSLTIYYLSKVLPKEDLWGATMWLRYKLSKEGFRWGKDNLLFSKYLIGAYAYALYCFNLFGMKKEKGICVKKLKENIRDGMMLRWERGFNWTIHPLKLYREVARLRYKDEIGRGSKILSKAIGLSTIEPMYNYKDFFMTTQVLNVLSELI